MDKNCSPAIDVYAICWNEELILPYFLRHYVPFARRIVVFDNGSTDASVSIIRSYANTEVREFGASRGHCGEAERMALREHAWRESRGDADWVIVVDCDEFLWHPDLLAYLDDCRRRDVTVPRPTGFEMIARRFPETNGQIYTAVSNGLRATHMDKWVIFNPRVVDSMNYAPGCHLANPIGRIAFDDNPDLRLLHFKHLGVEYALNRYRQLERRRTDEDREMGWCTHWKYPAEAIADWHHSAIQHAVEVLGASPP
jgi:glycosyltransferase involved in cell wall biosynthesis